MMSDDNVRRLFEAAEQCLDDMGDSGHCVCDHAKAMLRVALEPFLLTYSDPDCPLDYSLKQATAAIEDVERAYSSRCKTL